MIRVVMARKGDTPEYVRRMQKDLFDVLAKARSLDELRIIEPVAREVREKYMQGLEDADVRELAIHRRVSRMNYSRRCAEASAARLNYAANFKVLKNACMTVSRHNLRKCGTCERVYF